MFPIERVAEIAFPSVGACIYCFRKPPEVALTREHIIPDGLWGALVLPDASCVDCANIIREFERDIINSNYQLVRYAKGIHSKKRRRKARPTTYYEYDYGAQKHTADIEPTMPYMIVIESSGVRPTILTGQDPKSIKINRIKAAGTWPFRPNRTITAGLLGVGKMSRFMAKVAHGYAVAALGLDGFKPYLPPHILDGGTNTDVEHIGVLESTVRENVLHDIRCFIDKVQLSSLPMLPNQIKSLVIVHIDLFANHNLNPFEVVVGEIKGP